jgi:hypothetical protein
MNSDEFFETVDNIVQAVEHDEVEQAAILFLTVSPNRRKVLSVTVTGQLSEEQHQACWMDMSDSIMDLEVVVIDPEGLVHPASDLQCDLKLLSTALHKKHTPHHGHELKLSP